MSRLKITVRRKHIRKGDPQDDGSCPIALALIDKGYCSPSVGSETTFYTDGDKRYTSNLPRSARRFVSSFDAGRKVKPFSFFLNIY